MKVRILEIELILYSSQSLKDKRKVVKSIIDRTREKFNVSVSELAYQDSRNQACLAFAMVANENGIIDKSFSRIINLIDERSDCEIFQVTNFDC